MWFAILEWITDLVTKHRNLGFITTPLIRIVFIFSALSHPNLFMFINLKPCYKSFESCKALNPFILKIIGTFINPEQTIFYLY